jgi:membrane-associated phospholipid phosphatase
MKNVCTLFLILCLPIYVSAQTTDTIPQKKPFQIKPFIIPAAFVGYGIIAKSDNFLNKFDRSIQREVHTDNLSPSEVPEDILRYVPAVAVYGLNIAGIKGKNNLIDATGIYFMSNVILGVSVETTKRLTQHVRPDGSDSRSFPSGHSSTAFASAEFLRQEYQDVSPLYGYAGYTVAAATSYLRLRHNKHWFGDVVAGAGFGIISTKVAYLVYPEIKKLFRSKSNVNYTLLPSYQQAVVGLNFNATF